MKETKLFEYAVLFKPNNEDKGKDDPKEKVEILVDKTSVLASSPEEVSIVAAREIPDAYVERLDEVEIIVRPF